MTSDSDIISTFTPVFKRIKTVSKPAYMMGSKRKITSNNTSNVQNNFEQQNKSYEQIAKNNNTNAVPSNIFVFKKQKSKNNNILKIPDDTPYQDLGDYKEEFIFHWYKGEAHKKNLKKLCFVGSDFMIGCSWEQFGNDKHNDIKFITSKISDCASVMYNKFSKTTYFIFEEKEHAAKFLNTKYFHNGKSIELFCTIKYAEEVTIIKVPQLKFVRLKSAIRSICEMLEKHGGVKVICAKVKKESSSKEAEPEDKADHTAEKNEALKNAGMSQPILAKENIAIPTAKKVDAPITAAKPAIIADSKNRNDAPQTPTKPATDRKIAVPSENLKETHPSAAGKKIDLKGAIAAAISTNNIPLESSDIDVDITGESENANSSGMDIDSSD
ncbi:hypothetical protein AYI69_g10960, partial [Smittium culicis]